MAWDDEDNKKNPWQKQGEKGPADLDQIVRDFQKKLSGLLGSGGRGGGDGTDTRGSGGGVGGGLIAGLAVLAVAIWGLTGIYTVDEAERGIVLRFGEHVSTKLPGLRWHLPWPIEQVELVNTNRTEEYTYRGSMLTRDENIVIVDLIVQFRRTSPEDWLFEMNDPRLALEDVTGSAIREIVGKNELDFIITEGRAEVSAQTQELLQTTLDTYEAGITIYEVNLQDANFPAEVEGSVQDAIRAREDRERSILQSQAYSNEILPLARGQAARQIENAEAYRARVVANAEGEADRFLLLLGEYEKAPEVTRERLWLETLEEVLANSKKVIVDTEGGNNMLYVPLDQLGQPRGSAGVGNSGVNTVPLPSSANSSSSSSSSSQNSALTRGSR